MAPKKKKQPKNAFYYFLMDFKEKAETNGRNINNPDIDVEADFEWRHLNSERREHYENVAADRRLKKNYLENKFTTTGVSYAQLQREQMEKSRQKEIMINEIESTVRALTDSSLKHRMFHFVHVNYYCRLLDGHFLPCEIGIAKFNFQDGAKDCYHTIVNLECIPTGYFLECQKNSGETHQIPLPPENLLGERDNEKILVQIKAFLSENDTFPPVYTLQSNMEAAQDTLTTFALGEDLFRVYPISKLLFELRNACAFQGGGVGFPVESLAEREFEKDVFNLSPGISCEYHEGLDACQYCSLSIVKRWCYLFASLGCGDLGISLREGSHKPRKVILPPAPPERMVIKTPVSLRRGKKGARVAEPPPITIIDYSTKSSTNEQDVTSVPEIESSPLAQFGTYIRANETDYKKFETRSKDKFSSLNLDFGRFKTIPNVSQNNVNNNNCKKYPNHLNKTSHSRKKQDTSVTSSVFGRDIFPETSNENAFLPDNDLQCANIEPVRRSYPINNNEKQLGTFSLEAAAKLLPPLSIPQRMQFLHSEVKSHSPSKLTSNLGRRMNSADPQSMTNFCYFEDSQHDIPSLNPTSSLDFINTDGLQYENHCPDRYSNFIYDLQNEISPFSEQPLDDFDIFVEQTFRPVSEEQNNVVNSPYFKQRYGFDFRIGRGHGTTLESDLFSSQSSKGMVSAQSHFRQQWQPEGQQVFRKDGVLSPRLQGRGRGRSRSLSFIPE